MSHRVEVCRVDELPPGEGTVVRAGGLEIALFNVDGSFHAISNTCTHEGGPLGEGTLMDETVSCPWHYAAFDVTTGESLDPIAPHGVESYDTTVEDGTVLVEIPE